jgi:hypothetical protein
LAVELKHACRKPALFRVACVIQGQKKNIQK